ncbi:hypothetical protein Ddc_07424 [Ditylenchus destructor]|nr:hypothetical protein Ddc_07424 [Ditylenchus destructor]
MSFSVPKRHLCKFKKGIPDPESALRTLASPLKTSNQTTHDSAFILNPFSSKRGGGCLNVKTMEYQWSKGEMRKLNAITPTPGTRHLLVMCVTVTIHDID